MKQRNMEKYKVFYKHDHIESTEKLLKVFENVFPTFSKIFAQIKKRMPPKKEGKYNFAVLLQRVESTLVLDRICGRLTREKPTMCLFTIHDSLVVPISEKDSVAEIMADEIFKALGIKVKISPEPWTLTFGEYFVDDELLWNSDVGQDMFY